MKLPAISAAFAGSGVATYVTGGDPIVGSAGPGTVGFAAIDNANRRVFLTAFHVVGDPNGNVFANGPGFPRVGQCVFQKQTMFRNELYPPVGSSAEPGTYMVDQAMVLPDPGIYPVGGAPDGRPFSLGDTASAADWLINAPAVGWGALTSTDDGHKRTGTVCDLWTLCEGRRFLCTIKQDPSSNPGDSGGPWFAIVDGSYVALGFHYGHRDDDQHQFALVTDVNATLDAMRIQRLLRHQDE